ncbi:MAG: TlpA disulfide reductase family protein [Mucilaginibacter sp.]|jgi:peroxiredoxin|uniref:TlpA family protein disulfide reductase n=1 Tax=Mucilaginibacter sp. TaxID=1882438 RepID=UPI0035643DAD
MKYPSTLLLILLSLNLVAQKITPMADYAVIKGHIKNNTENLWDFSQTGLLSYATLSVPVDKRGDFIKKIKVEGEAMDVFIRPGSRLIFVKKNDTLTINWDANDIRNTFSISSGNRDRNRDLHNLAMLDSTCGEAYGTLQNSLYQKGLTDSARFSAINELYNKEIETLIKDGVYTGSIKIAIDIYFKYTQQMFRLKLLPRYELYIEKPSQNSVFIPVITQKGAYAIESEEWFRLSSTYRDFIFDYVRFFKPLKSASVMGSPAETAKKMLPFSPAWQEYYTGLNSLYITEVRDWFSTKCIMGSFYYYSFTESTEVYKDFITKVKTPYYADTLKQFYQNIQRLKPGMPAPGFTLKDDNGNMVSLAQFNGKTVYIDFWGVGCGPCIYDIKNSVPALHEKYKDKNIVFINICVDSDEPTWKESLKNLNLHGINLIAPGWNKHPMVKSYNVNGIPHYYLIDTNGNIAENNSPGPTEKEALYAKLDEILKAR